MKKPKNRMSQQEFFKLCQYLAGNKDAMDGLPWPAISTTCKQSLGLEIDVTRQHLVKAQDSLGVDWIIPAQEKKTAKAADADLRKALSVVAHHLAELYRAEGAGVPAELRDLCATNFELETTEGA